MHLAIVIPSEVRQRKRNITWYCLYVDSWKRYKWTYLQNRNRVADIENKLTVTREWVGSNKVGGWGWHAHTTLYEMATPVARWQRIHLQFSSHRRCRFGPWVGKIPWRRAWQRTLKNPTDRGSWQARVYRFTKSARLLVWWWIWPRPMQELESEEAGGPSELRLHILERPQRQSYSDKNARWWFYNFNFLSLFGTINYLLSPAILGGKHNYIILYFNLQKSEIC